MSVDDVPVEEDDEDNEPLIDGDDDIDNGSDRLTVTVRQCDKKKQCL